MYWKKIEPRIKKGRNLKWMSFRCKKKVFNFCGIFHVCYGQFRNRARAGLRAGSGGTVCVKVQN